MEEIYRNYEKFSKNEKKKEDYKRYVRAKLKKKEKTDYQRLYLARQVKRPKTSQFLQAILQDPLYFNGDGLGGDDKALLGGIGKIKDHVVTFLAIDKGKDLEDSQEKNFGMLSPQGFRKAIRLMKQAEKFNRPLVTFVDTPGAYPGMEAEMEGQASAIAHSIATLCGLNVPVISVITGEGYSGGALGLTIGDRLIMLENAVYSILSPEGFASILWKNGRRVEDAVKLLRFSAFDMVDFGICDYIVTEGDDILFENFQSVYEEVKDRIAVYLDELKNMSGERRLWERRRRFQQWD